MSKKIIAQAAILIGMLVSVFAQGVCAYAEDKNEISEDIFRLHVLANSDSDEDQGLKLKVRDAVLAYGADVFESNCSANEAAKKAEEHVDEFKMIAEKTIKDNGYDYSVNCEVVNMYFDTRIYGSVTMPQGDYEAMRITIGEAEGKNWWCVMFPPLCLPAVTNVDDVLENAKNDGVLTEEEIEIMRNPENYEVKFYCVELFQKLSDYFDKT